MDGEIKDPATLKQGRCRVGIEVLQDGCRLVCGDAVGHDTRDSGLDGDDGRGLDDVPVWGGAPGTAGQDGE